jgi:hypothetical protein
VCIAAFAWPAQAISLGPEGAMTGMQNATPRAIAEFLELGELTDLKQLYKQDYGSKKDEKEWADQFSTSFILDDEDEPTGAEITFDGSGDLPSFDGALYLFAKSGKQDPAWYAWKLEEFDGTVSVDGLWPEKGSISHVALFSATPPPTTNPPEGSNQTGEPGITTVTEDPVTVPEMGATLLLLLMSSATGLAVARRKR